MCDVGGYNLLNPKKMGRQEDDSSLPLPLCCGAKGTSPSPLGI